MNHLRAWLRLSLPALLLVAFVPGCANDIRRKAEIAREEAGYLETNPVMRWMMENGKTDWDVPTFRDIELYIPESHPIRQRGGNDPFGNPYVFKSVEQGVAVNAKTIQLCAEATKQNPAFWGHHDERVLSLIQAAKTGDTAAVRTLLPTIPDPNIANYYGQKALVYAMAMGNDEMEKILTSHGAVLDPGDGTPLWWAMADPNVKVVRSLLDRFPYMATATNIVFGPEVTIWQGALCDAIKSGNAEIVKMLLEHGADPNTLDGKPLTEAVGMVRLDIVKLLVEAGAQITPKALSSHSQEIREYLESRVNTAKTKGRQIQK